MDSFCGSTRRRHRGAGGGRAARRRARLSSPESDGQFLWQHASPKLAAGRVNDWPFQGVASSPLVEGERLYYVSNRAKLTCVDTKGFSDNENDGPIKDEKLTGPKD